MSILEPTHSGQKLFAEISGLIEKNKNYVAQSANASFSLLYWQIGRRIKEDMLTNQRAEYEKQSIARLSLQLTETYGAGFSEKNIRRMVQFAVGFPNEHIVVSAIRQLSWSYLLRSYH